MKSPLRAKWLWLLAIILLAGCAWLASTPHSNIMIDPNKPHHKTNGFRNNFRHEKHGFKDFLRWQWERGGPAMNSDITLPVAENNPAFLQQNRTQPTLTWVGHSTFLLQFAGLNILTDPHFTKRASPLSFIGPARQTPLGLTLEDLPEIHAVVISHDHYDHLDVGSVEALTARQPDNPPRFFVPLQLKAWFADLGIDNVVELDWWDAADFAGWKIHAVPVQHFSGRGPITRNETLWAGWVLEHPQAKFFFAGDTGYSKDFADIGQRLGPIDLALIPIGAYEPRWFMRAMHVNPTEAVKIHQDVRARRSVGMHWGTFILTDEALDQPPIALANARAAAGIADEDFIVLKHGQTQPLTGWLLNP